MAEESVKQRIRDALRMHFRDGDTVDVSDGLDDNIHVVVVSRQFDGRHPREKHDLIWSVLTDKLPDDDWGRITLTIGMSPEELKVLT